MEFVERLLQDAADRGEFDAGSASGRPLRLDDSRPGWWARRETARISAEGHAAEVIRDVEDALGGVWILPSEQAVRTRIQILNERLTGAGAADALLDPEQVVGTWRRMARLRLHRRHERMRSDLRR